MLPIPYRIIMGNICRHVNRNKCLNLLLLRLLMISIDHKKLLICFKCVPNRSKSISNGNIKFSNFVLIKT